MNALNSAVRHDTTSWLRVTEVADLAEIYKPDVQVCSWQRSIDPLITTYLSGLSYHGKLQFIETLEPDKQAELNALPAGAGKQQLLADLALLTEIFCDLLG